MSPIRNATRRTRLPTRCCRRSWAHRTSTTTTKTALATPSDSFSSVPLSHRLFSAFLAFSAAKLTLPPPAVLLLVHRHPCHPPQRPRRALLDVVRRVRRRQRANLPQLLRRQDDFGGSRSGQLRLPCSCTPSLRSQRRRGTALTPSLSQFNLIECFILPLEWVLSSKAYGKLNRVLMGFLFFAPMYVLLFLSVPLSQPFSPVLTHPSSSSCSFNLFLSPLAQFRHCPLGDAHRPSPRFRPRSPRDRARRLQRTGGGPRAVPQG